MQPASRQKNASEKAVNAKTRLKDLIQHKVTVTRTNTNKTERQDECHYLQNAQGVTSLRCRNALKSHFNIQCGPNAQAA